MLMVTSPTFPWPNSAHRRVFCLLALYPNSTHLLQPLDVSVFKSLKSLWATAKIKWKKTHSNENINKISFPIVFKGAVDQITLSTVVNGFRKAGLCPLDPGKVDYSKCVRDQLQQKCEEAELSSPVSDPAVFQMRCGLRFLEERIGHVTPNFVLPGNGPADKFRQPEMVRRTKSSCAK